jgi:nucleoid-associated protein YgaU
MHATVAQQTEIANKQFAISGYTAWNASKDCWRGKIGTPSSPRVTEPAPRATAPAPRVSTPQRATPQRATPRATPQRSAPHVSTPSRQHVGHGKAITVRSGDTLGKIAARNGTTWQHLFDANRGVVRDPNLIFPGQRLAA